MKTFDSVSRIFDNEGDIFIFSRNVKKTALAVKQVISEILVLIKTKSKM